MKKQIYTLQDICFYLLQTREGLLVHAKRNNAAGAKDIRLSAAINSELEAVNSFMNRIKAQGQTPDMSDWDNPSSKAEVTK